MHEGWKLRLKREIGTDVGKGSRLRREKVGEQVGSTVWLFGI
jgi:hypothetical protein